MPRPFTDDDLDAAAGFLAERHARHRAAEPLLPEEVDFRAEVEAAWRLPDASGAVSEHGYLIGAPREDPVWGANVWVELAGHAVAEAEAARDLYAFAAGRWVDEGNTRHYAILPAHAGALVDAWFHLSFGQQHASGIREVPEQVEWPEGVRPATEADVGPLIGLAPLLRDHQATSPVFGAGRHLESEEELRKDILETIESGASVDLVAEVEGHIAGGFYVTRIEESAMHTGLARPPGAAFLAWAAVRPELRGGGVGLRLTQAALAWARSHGHETMVTDWRVTNLLASRFWPARGFRTTFIRLYRSIP